MNTVCLCRLTYGYLDLFYLDCFQDRYDIDFVKEVYSATLLTAPEAFSGDKPEEKKVRVQYSSKDEFKRFAKVLGIMDDFKVAHVSLSWLSLWLSHGSLSHGSLYHGSLSWLSLWLSIVACLLR